ncbi:ABC transporter substrate-binding protein [Kibdelosporangium lantanae]
MRAVLPIVATAVLVAGCGGGAPGPGGQNPVNGRTFAMVLAADPGNLDPYFTSLSLTLQVDRFLYDTLLDVDPTGKLVAGLADTWETTATTAKFTLRKGITCGDGTPLAASAVAADVNFVGDPKNASSRIGLFVPAGATATADDGSGTVTVTAPTPNPFLDRILGQLQVVCPKGMSDRGTLKQGASGTGMFTVAEAVPGDHYTLTRRPGYWLPDQPGLPDKVVLRVVGNESTAVNLLMSGEVNAAAVIGPDQQRLQAQNTFRRDVLAVLGELWFNHRAGQPGADPAVRRALTQAVDLGQLTQVLTSGTGKVAEGLIAPGMSPCDGNTIAGKLPAYDPAAAKSTLDNAGWRPGPDGIRAKDGRKLSMALFYSTELGPTVQPTVELVQKFWSAVGVEVTAKGGAETELSQVVLAGQGSWDVALVPLNTTLPTELVPFLSGPTAPDGTNFANVQNPAYTAAVRAAMATTGTAGCGKWAEAEQAIAETVDVLPFANSNRPYYGRSATFDLSQGSLVPSSIRMLG